MNKLLSKTEFGNYILRSVSAALSNDQILNDQTQQLISDMHYTLELKKYGVGLAAPQIGKSLAIAIIDTKPTPTRPNIKRQKLTIINPKIVKTYGALQPEWEGCISGTELYAQVPRYEKIRLAWQNEEAAKHEQDFDGFIAHVIQHEVDHLNGIIFLDKVTDTKSFMTFKEYKKMKVLKKVK